MPYKITPATPPIRTTNGDPQNPPVEVVWLGDEWYVRAYNQSGHDVTETNLRDVIAWVLANTPHLLTGREG